MEVSCSKLSWSPVAQVVTLCIGTLISFLIAYNNGSVSAYLPFISETGAHVPQMCIFSYTLSLGAILGIVAVTYRHMVVSYMLPPEDTRLHKLNYVGLVSGIVSMIGLVGVAAFPMSTVLWAHLLVAGVHFGLGVFYLFVQTFITFKVPPPHMSMSLAKIRLVLATATLVSLILLGVCFPIGYVKWKQLHKKPHARKTPQDEGFGILLASSLFEWLFQLTFLIFFATFFKEFRKFESAARVTEKEKIDPEVENTGKNS